MESLANDVRANVVKWWTRIRHAGAVERPREWTDAKAWSEGALDGVKDEKGRVREQFAETESAWFASRNPDPSRAPRENYYHSQAAKYCSLSGWCLTLLEAVFAGGLTVLLLTLPWFVAAVVGIVITVLLALGLKGWVSAKVARYQERPKEGRDWALRLLTRTAPIAIVTLGLLFLMRGVAGAWVAAMFPVAMAIAALVTPIIAGALLTLSSLYRWSKDLTLRFRELEQAERELVELRDAATRGLQPPQTRPTLATTLAKTATVMLLAVSILSGAACDSIQAQSGSSAVASHAADRNVQGQVAATGEWWFDETSSVDQRDVPHVQEIILTTLRDTSIRRGITRWLFYGFGAEPWREVPFFEFSLPKWNPPTCEPPSEASRVFKLQQTEQLSKCDSLRIASRAEYDRRVEDALAQLRAALSARRPKSARCTGIADLLERLAQTPDRVAIGIASDGTESCRGTGLPAVGAPPSDTRVSFILVSGSSRETSRTLGQNFAARREALLRSAPWLRVVAPWQVTPELFDRE